MSAHDARYEDSPAYDDEPGTTATRTEHQVGSIDRDTTDRDDTSTGGDTTDQDTTDRDDTTTRDDTIDRDTSVGDGPFGRLDEAERAETFDRDDEVIARHDVTDGGPVLLPVDPQPEPTTDDDGPTRSDSAPVTIVDGEKSEDLASGDTTLTPDGVPTPAGFGTGSTGTPDGTVTSGNPDSTKTTDSTESTVTTGSADVGVGPDTESGALKDPVPDGAFTAGETTVVPVIDPATSSSGSATPASSPEPDWRELQGRFVDDPQAAVREAGALVEKALADLRTRSESGSTEDLRTAFRRYRDLHAGLS